MFCEKCGAPILDESAFCSKCGVRINRDDAPAEKDKAVGSGINAAVSPQEGHPSDDVKKSATAATTSAPTKAVRVVRLGAQGKTPTVKRAFKPVNRPSGDLQRQRAVETLQKLQSDEKLDRSPFMGIIIVPATKLETYDPSVISTLCEYRSKGARFLKVTIALVLFAFFVLPLVLCFVNVNKSVVMAVHGFGLIISLLGALLTLVRSCRFYVIGHGYKGGSAVLLTVLLVVGWLGFPVGLILPAIASRLMCNKV